MDLTELTHFDNTQRHPWELARFRVITHKLQKLINDKLKSPDVTGSLKILDIGCGDTFLVSSLALAFPDHEFIGVDINFTDQHLEWFQQKYQNTNVSIFRSLEDLHGNKSADIVLILDVIEHIEDDLAFLQMIRESTWLSSDTKVLITVPAYPNLFSDHDVILGHVRRYTNESLAHTLVSAGYELDWISYFFFTLLPLRQLQVWRQGSGSATKERASDLVRWKGGIHTTRFVTNLLNIDYRISLLFKRIGVKLPGLSNIVLCHPLPS